MNFLESFDLLISPHLHTNVCVAGDFHAKHSFWYNGKATDVAGENLKQFSDCHDLLQVVRNPSNSTAEQKSSLLDLIFVNQPSFVVSSSVLSSLADHCPVEVRFSLKKSRLPKPYISQRFVYSEADIDGLHTALAGTDWNGLLCGSVCEATTAWTETFLDVCKRFVPLRGVRVDQTSKPWYSSYFKYLASCRDRLFKRSRGKDPSSAAMVAYRKLRTLFVSEMRAAEKRYFADLGQTLLSPDSNPQRWWSLAK